MKKLIIPGFNGKLISGYIDNDTKFNFLIKSIYQESKKNINIFVLIDLKVYKLFRTLIHRISKINNCRIICIDATEGNKSFEVSGKIIAKILKHEPSKNDLVINVGGGIILNIGGFLASIILRGLRFIQVPTTLSSCTDVFLGGKQAVNFKGYKNQIGLYNDPITFYINTSFLKTIKYSELKIQLIEGLKLCLTSDRILFWEILNNLQILKSKSHKVDKLIEKLIKLKSQFVEKDPFELQSGIALLYGHTIGHSIEMLSNGKISHCEAVGIGMYIASKIAFELKVCDAETVNVHKLLLDKLNIIKLIPSYIKVSDIMNHIKHDKKKYNGEVHFVLIEKVGNIYFKGDKYYKQIPSHIIKKVLKDSY